MPTVLGPNRIRAAVESGNAALGFGILTFSPDAIEAVGRAGVDFIWLDLEHSGVSPYDSTALAALVRAADAVGASTMIRVPEIHEAMIAKVLDTGASAILAPDVQDADSAERLVSCSKFMHHKRRSSRGAPLARIGGWAVPDETFGRDSDEKIMVGAMIESRDAIENLDSILSVEGLDYVFLGPADLSRSLGLDFQTSHPTVKEHLTRAKDICVGRKMPVGLPVSDAEAAKKAIADGYRILRIGVDIPLIVKNVKAILKEIRG